MAKDNDKISRLKTEIYEVKQMMNYKCEIGDYGSNIEAASPADAARKCVSQRTKEFAWFANESPELSTVTVNGTDYTPKSMSDGPNTWDFTDPI